MQVPFTRGMLIAALLAGGCGSSATSDNAGGSAGGDAVAAVETPPPDQGRELPPEQDPEPVAEPAAEENPATIAATTTAESPAPAAQPEAAAATVTLVDMPWEAVVEQIATHKGKIVVVDLWATYCAPCRASFPGLVALSRHDPANIVCVSVSLDDPADAEKRAAALQFLQEQQAEFTNVLCTTESDTLYDEILQIGGIPAVYVYGRDGAQAKVFTGPSPEREDHTYEQHITPYVLELAAAGN